MVRLLLSIRLQDLLTWQDNSDDETNYRTKRSLNGISEWVEIVSLNANSTNYNSPNQFCGTTYYFRVRAYRQGDNQYSNYSNSANDSTFDGYENYLPLIVREHP